MKGLRSKLYHFQRTENEFLSIKYMIQNIQELKLKRTRSIEFEFRLTIPLTPKSLKGALHKKLMLTWEPKGGKGTICMGNLVSYAAGFKLAQTML